MTRRIQDVLRSLEDYQIKIGFDDYKDVNAASIYETESPFIIKKSEWERALMLGMGMPIRAVGDWWKQFQKLGYLVSLPEEEPQAWLLISNIKRDIEPYHGNIRQFLEGVK